MNKPTMTQEEIEQISNDVWSGRHFDINKVAQRDIVKLAYLKGRQSRDDEVRKVLKDLSEEFNEAGYLQHEQRYKVSCRVDKVLKELKLND